MKQQLKLINIAIRAIIALILAIIALQLSSLNAYISRIEVVLSTREFADINQITIPAAQQVAQKTIPNTHQQVPPQQSVPEHTTQHTEKQPVENKMSPASTEASEIQSIPEFLQETDSKKVYPDAKEHIVEMLNYGDSGAMVYQPAVIKINEGDSIRFKPSSYGHNAQTIEDIINNNDGIPKGASTWKGNMNEEFTVTFTVPGIYLYACTYHYIVGHVGVIMVGDNKQNMPEIKRAAAMLKSKMLSNGDRVDKYLAQLN